MPCSSSNRALFEDENCFFPYSSSNQGILEDEHLFQDNTICLFHRDSDHLGDTVNVVPDGMGDGAVHEKGFILVDDDVAVTKDDSRFALGDDEKVVVVMGMQFRRPAAVEVHIGHGAVDDVADSSEQFLRMEIHVLRGES